MRRIQQGRTIALIVALSDCRATRQLATASSAKALFFLEAVYRLG